jgi:hypothetical protein
VSVIDPEGDQSAYDYAACSALTHLADVQGLSH